MARFDFEALRTWMDAEGLGAGPLVDPRPVTGGTQNMMFRFHRGDAEYVVRRGPEHLRPGSNKVIAREMTLLQALRGTAVPHPRFIAGCVDPDVLDGATFYLMAPVEGFCAGQELPALHASDAEVRRRMGLEMARALAALGAIDYQAVGLHSFGKPEGFLDRQVGRWLAELDSYRELAGYPGPEIGPVDDIATWLTEHTPSTFTPGIIHGDYHASNVLFDRGGPAVSVIVDWEMATIGDPLLDLGWLLATWDLPGAPEEFGGVLTSAGGLASQAELVEAYAAHSTRDLTHLDYYVVLACFKLGLILEGSYARALAGLAPPEIGERLHRTTKLLLQRAVSVINQR